MTMWEKLISARAVRVITHFSELIERKKVSYVVLYFKAFYNYGCLIISEKYR